MSFRCAALTMALMVSIALTGCLGSGKSQPTQGLTVTSITISPENSAVTVGKTVQFSAQATMSDGTTKDITSTATWVVSDSTLAKVSSSGLVTGLKLGLASVGVASGTAKAATVLNVTTKSFSQGSLNGSYAFSLTSETDHPRFEVGSIKADGAGTFTGVEDINAAAGVQKAVPVSGTYTVSPDGRGSLIVNTTGLPSRTFHFVLSANSGAAGDNNAPLIQFDKADTAVGQLQKQNKSAFSNTSLASHTYVFRVGGLDATQNAISRVGEFALDSTGTALASGEQDENDNGTINSGGAGPVTISSGTVGAVDSTTGRATVTLNVGSQAVDFAAYVISANKMAIIGLDAAPMLLGEAELQSSPVPAAATAAGYTLLTEIGGNRGQFWIVGALQLDSGGHETGLVQSQDGGITLNYASGGGLTTPASGRAVLYESTNQGLHPFTAYLVSGTRMYLMQTDDAHAASGIAESQDPGQDGFGAATLNNSFVLVAADTSDGKVALVGQVVADGAGHITGMVDVSQPEAGNPSQLTVSTVPLGATFQAPTNAGFATGNISTAGAGVQSFKLYLVSSGKAQFLGVSPIDVNGSLLVQ